ncbi:hypothetical protein [uncultured Metabacillus sp.]|uniref:hypothetical protein n=1 Tax=uncultured Metabacillus sp. TaxID=2860135 RepID=UPI002603CDFA|nr:hypothetical protein [uncultured Metabacillus sp.]
MIIEQVFRGLLENVYRRHDHIQRKEDANLYRKERELNQMDRLSDEFEQRMELAAVEMEKWLIKHKPIKRN